MGTSMFRLGMPWLPYGCFGRDVVPTWPCFCLERLLALGVLAVKIEHLGLGDKAQKGDQELC